jgi:hypothetical protein
MGFIQSSPSPLLVAHAQQSLRTFWDPLASPCPVPASHNRCTRGGTILILRVSRTSAHPCEHDAWEWAAGQLGRVPVSLLAGLTEAFMNESGKGCGRVGAFLVERCGYGRHLERCRSSLASCLTYAGDVPESVLPFLADSHLRHATGLAIIPCDQR